MSVSVVWRCIVGMGFACVLLMQVMAEESSAQRLTIRLWPEGRLAAADAEEKVMPDRGDTVRRISNISQPSMTVYPAKAKDGGVAPAVLVFPGGGYSILAINKEGEEIAEWLNGIGVTAFVVRYRVPNNRQGAFEDGQRAIRLVRQRAKEWGVDPKSVGVIGFSAGGHLSARLSANFEKSAYVRVDEADDQPLRPDFCMLIYPAYLQDKSKQLPAELPVSAKIPPTFMVQTKDDKGFVGGTIAYDEALKKAGVSSVFHLYDQGGHGYGMRPSEHEVSKWPVLAAKWMKDNGVKVRE